MATTISKLTITLPWWSTLFVRAAIVAAVLGAKVDPNRIAKVIVDRARVGVA